MIQQTLGFDLGELGLVLEEKCPCKKLASCHHEQFGLDFDCKKRKKKSFTRQRVAKFFERRYGERGRSVAKRFRRLKKYKNLGQYLNGIFYCKSGKPITEDRIGQYDKMCHKIVRQFLPALALYEKSYNYDDLVISCKREVFLALLDGFDPKKAMTSTIQDPGKRKLAEHKKWMNPEKTLSNSEKNIVWGRLKNWVRRERHKYSPKELGGRTQFLDIYVDGQLRNNEYSRGCFTEVDSLIPDYIHQIKDELIGILEDSGPECVLIAYHGLGDYDSEQVVKLLTGPNNPLSRMMSEDTKEYNNVEGH